jgi:hypothetical protein
MSTLNVASIQALSTNTTPTIKDSAGTEFGKFCKVYCRYNMQSNTLLGSFGVSSITDNGTGVCTVNFTTAFSSDTSYAAAVLGNGNVANGAHTYPSTFFGGIAAGSFKIGFFRNENSLDRVDQLRVWFSFFE